MNLHSPKFENALRRSARAAVRRSPELKRAARRANVRFRKHYSANIIVRFIFSAFVGLCAYGIANQNGSIPAALAFVNLWTFAWLFFRTQSLLAALYQSSDLQVFSFLPIEKPMLFRWELQKFFRASVMSLLDLMAGFGAIALYVQSAPAVAGLLPATILAWGVMLSIAMLCGSRWPRFPYGAISMIIICLAVALSFARNMIGPILMAGLDRFAVPLNVLLPTGWTESVYLLLAGHANWTCALLLVPIGALLSTIPGSLARLRAHYNFREIILHEAPDLLPAEVEENAVAISEPGEEPLRVDSDMIGDIVRKHLFSDAAKWRDRSWLEKTLWRWLTPRERILAEFSFPYGISMLPGWKKIFRNVGITFVAAIVAGYGNSDLEIWIISIGMLVTVFQVAAKLFAPGVGFRPIRIGGLNVPFYAGYGIGFREFLRMLVKYTAVQIPFLMLYAALCGGLLPWLFGGPIGVGIFIAVKAAGVMAAMRFIFVTLSFSSGTNDSGRFRLRTFILVPTVLALGGLFLALAVAGVFVPYFFTGMICWLLSLVAAYAFALVYGGFYNGKWFDLMNVPRK